MRKYLSLYVTIGVIAFAAALIGFSKTFIFPVAAGTFSGPMSVYVHGAFTFCWVVLFLVQASLIKVKIGACISSWVRSALSLHSEPR
ncbi:hypothetical protein BH20ACI2_BH20ACI2_08460 [soil metagenome]